MATLRYAYYIPFIRGVLKVTCCCLPQPTRLQEKSMPFRFCEAQGGGLARLPQLKGRYWCLLPPQSLLLVKKKIEITATCSKFLVNANFDLLTKYKILKETNKNIANFTRVEHISLSNELKNAIKIHGPEKPQRSRKTLKTSLLFGECGPHLIHQCLDPPH